RAPGQRIRRSAINRSVSPINQPPRYNDPIMKARRASVLMVAYTNYDTDPRVLREAEAAASAGFDVDFIALRRNNDPKVETIRGVRVFHLNQQRYRGSSRLNYMLAYLRFLIRCFLKTTRLYFKRRYCIVHVNNM